MLYRQLSFGAERERLEMAGPLVLLQHWCWSRLRPGRPVDQDRNPISWGEPDPESCPTFGAKWCGQELYPLPHNSGVAFYRNLLDQVQDNEVSWEPYNGLLMSMPRRVRAERAFWYSRVPLIHFWIIEFHYPDRVMRQLGRKQTIPPPPPHDESKLRQLHKINHTGKPRDWRKLHAEYVNQYNRIWQSMVDEEQHFDQASLPQYRHWFQQYGMYTVFWMLGPLKVCGIPSLIHWITSIGPVTCPVVHLSPDWYTNISLLVLFYLQ